MDDAWESLLENGDHSGKGEAASERRWFVAELRKQLWIAGPMIAVNFLEYSLIVVSLMFVGHFGELALAGASLASSFSSVTGFSLLLGMGNALETLCGQAYGAENYAMVGVYFQRGLVVLYLTALPVALVWANMARILILLGQDPEIARKAGEYALCLIPTLFAYAALQPLVKFLQSQSLVFVMSFTSFILIFFHTALCYLLVFHLGVGFRGAAIATSVSTWVNVAILGVYVRFWVKKTWTGFSTAAFKDLGRLVRIAIPSAIMVSLEYWSFELLVIVSGLLPNPKLETSTLSVCMTTSSLMYMIPTGLGGATSTRVSNELGAGNSRAARRAVLVALCLSAVEGGIVCLLLFSLRNTWGWLFTTDPEVANYVSRLMPFLALLACIDAIQGVFSGVVRGGGWQAFGAATNLGAYYGVGLPIGLVLAFKLHWNDVGFWIGLMCGNVTQASVVGGATALTNWEHQARAAVNRVAIGSTKSSEGTVKEALLQ